MHCATTVYICLSVCQDLSVFPFLPRHYHTTRVLTLPFITTVWTPVVLAIINIIQATLKMFMTTMMTSVPSFFILLVLNSADYSVEYRSYITMSKVSDRLTWEVAAVDSTLVQLWVVPAIVSNRRAAGVGPPRSSSHRRQHQQTVAFRRTARRLVRTAAGRGVFGTGHRCVVGRPVACRGVGQRRRWREQTANGRRQLGRTHDRSTRRRQSHAQRYFIQAACGEERQTPGTRNIFAE